MLLSFFLLNINSASAITFVPDSLISDSIPASITESDTLAHGDTLKADTSASGELKSKIKYSARDSIRFDMEEEKTYLMGDAVVDYEDLHLKAAMIVIDMNKKEIYAEGIVDSAGTLLGKPEFAQGGQQFRSTSIRYNFDTKKGKLTYLITKEGQGFVHGEVVKKDQYNDFYVRNGIYTTCDLDTPHFSLAARKLKLVNTGKANKIVTGPAFLTIENVPTPLFIPFGFFPNQKGRSSGIIFPAFGESAQRGFYFQHLGYYFGFNDYYNLAITSDLYTKGSYNLTASTNYVKRYQYRGGLSLSYSKNIESEPELPDYSSVTDFHITWNHSQDDKAKPNSRFSASVSAGSSTYFRNNLSSPVNFLNNTLQSSISYSKLFPGKPYNLGISMSHSQNTQTRDISVTAPEVNFGVSRINPFKRKIVLGTQKWYEKIGASYTMNAKNTVQTKDTLLFRSETLDTLKYGVSHTLPVSTSFNVLKYLSVSPSINYTEKWYWKTIRKRWNADSARVETYEVKEFSAAREWGTSVSMSTRIYGMYQFMKGPVTALRHVMTPSVSFSYHPDFSQVKYGNFKFVQTDTNGTISQYSIYEGNIYGGTSSGKSGTIGFGLDNNFEMKVKTGSDTGEAVKKIKLFESLRIGASYNLAIDSMRLSPISFSGRTTILEKLNISFSGTLNPYDYDTSGRFIDRYLIKSRNKLATLTSINFSTGVSLAGKKANPPANLTEEQLAYYYQNPDAYVDFNVPYNLSIDYTYHYSKNPVKPAAVSQSVNITGDLNLTPMWKIGFYTWYDFEDHRFTNLNLNIYRDLHCWEMRFTWIPFGLQESYTFQINVKSSVLQDLKWIKKKDFYDR